MNHSTPHTTDDDLILDGDLEGTEHDESNDYPLVPQYRGALRFDAHLLTHAQGLTEEHDEPAAFDVAAESAAAEAYLRNEMEVDGVVWDPEGEGADDELSRFAERLEQLEGDGDSYRTAPRLRVTRWNRLMRDQDGVTIGSLGEVY